MKNILRWGGIIACVTIIGFSMTACKEKEEDPWPPVSFKIKIFNASSNHTITRLSSSGGTYDLDLGPNKTSEELAFNNQNAVNTKDGVGYYVRVNIAVRDTSDDIKDVRWENFYGDDKPPARIGLRYTGTQLQRYTRLDN